MKKNYEIRLAWLQLALCKLRTNVVDVIIEYANVLFEMNPPFRKRRNDETKDEYTQLFIENLTNWIDKKQAEIDFVPIIERLEKTINA